MYEFRVELVKALSEDYAGYYFSVYASSEAEAWVKALALEDADNIRSIRQIRWLG